MPLYQNPDFRQLPSGPAKVFAQAGQASFFALPLWYDLLVRFGVPAGTEIRVYTDERPGSTMAVLFRVEPGPGIRCLSSLANFYSVEHGVIAAPDAELDRGLAAILSEILAERPGWDCVRLAELNPRNPEYAASVRSLRRAGFRIECIPGAATWYEATADVKFSDFVTQRPSQLRNTWRRKHRNLTAAGRLRASFLSDAADIEAAIEDYQTVYAASWKPPEPFPHFTPGLIRLAAELGALRLGIYYFDGIPAAAQFWILWRGRATIYKLAHDRSFDKWSLGTLLTMAMIERVLTQDCPDEINFGRGDDPYKRLWLPKRRERWGIVAANPRTVRGLRLGFAREAAKLYHRVRGEPLAPPSATG